MTTYTATFSNGQTKTRTSHRQYRYAVGLVNKTTGKLLNVTFTNSDTPRPNWWGVADLATSANSYGLSSRDRDRHNKATMLERANWSVEVVALS
jgi:hypothetical protein